MRKNSIIENKLKQEIKVPEQVQNRVDDTLKAITQEKHISLQETKTTQKSIGTRDGFGWQQPVCCWEFW